MVYRYIPPEPSTEYENKSLGTWSTTTDVDTFFTTHTYYNGWSGLKIGNYVTINDGTYNVDWVIAGFNTETATDDTPGGIVFIPRYTNLTTFNWDHGFTTARPYNSSDIHSDINSTIKTNLSTILGSHIVQRNVTLGSACNSSTWYTSATTNTTAYLTLMSWGQLSGTFGSHNNSYDDGEANYKLPLFNFIDNNTYAGGTIFWLRNVYGAQTVLSVRILMIYCVGSNGVIDRAEATDNYGVRPLMYLR